MNIAIVDDVAEETRKFRDAVREYSALNRTVIDIVCFSSAEDFLADYAPLRYSMIVLDIYMDGMSGIEAAKKIKEQDRDALIVFLSSSSDHFPDALRLHAYDFLNKPTDKRRIFELLDDILMQKTEVCGSLGFTCGKETIRIPYNCIASISASGHYTEITDESTEVYKTRTSYTSIMELLSGDKRFLEINRGIVVNMDMITSFDDGICCMKSGKTFPTNVKNRKILEQTWQNYMFAVMRNETIRRK